MRFCYTVNLTPEPALTLFPFQELCDEMSAEHLVMSQLRLMERLPLAVEPPGAAAGDGDGDGEGEGGRGAAAAPGTPAALAAAVRSRCWAHRSKDVKALGARVVATWERRGGWQGGRAIA